MTSSHSHLEQEANRDQAGAKAEKKEAPLVTMILLPGEAEMAKRIRVLRLPEVINRVGLKRASIYAAIASGAFPKQIVLGNRAVGWIEQEIDAWLAERVKIARTK